MRTCGRWGGVWLTLAGLACSGESPMSPTSDDPVSALTVTITTNGVEPATIRIQPGERVLFVNDDTVDHEMASDEHPFHTECPPLNQVGFLRPGARRETGNFVLPRTCAYHDHLDALNPALRGSIVIVESSS